MTDEDEHLSEAEREYRTVVARRQEWRETRQTRRARRKQIAREIGRESLPNIIGTVVGAGIVYVVAVVSGLIQGVQALDVAAFGALGLILAYSFWAGFSGPPGPQSEIVEMMERDALRAEVERLRQREAERGN